MNSAHIINRLQSNKLAILWLKIGVISLALAGIYSIILVILRTPYLNKLFTDPEIFKAALVVHVNLSVLIWLLSITASIWSHNSKENFAVIIYVILAFSGSVLIAISPFCGQTYPIMNNYIPMLENIIFILGLTMFGVAILLYAILMVYQTTTQIKSSSNLINNAILSSSLIFILTVVCFVCSYLQLNKIINIIPIDLDLYYEFLFWSGGHLLQFVYTQILIIIWIILFKIWLGKSLKFERFYLFILYLNFILSLPAVAGHYFFDIIDGEFKQYYTDHMKYCGGIAPILALGLLFYEVFFLNPSQNGNDIDSASCAKASIICSSLLFLFGGLIGFKISGMNVVVPAHYHGSIVGMSIAFMGYAYLVSANQFVIARSVSTRQSTSNDVRFPRRLLAFAMKIFSKFLTYQVSIYTLTLGQILHISGLALSGGYGVLRKTPSIEMHLSAKLFMGMMGGGGLIAIVGGLMFVFICGKNLLIKNKY